MAKPLRILLVASEIAPFAKTGGLADVAGALPQALARLGHDVRLAMPLYGTVDRYKHRLLPVLRRLDVALGNEKLTGEVMRTAYPGAERVPVYFIQQDSLYLRSGLYGEASRDYPDNDRRFAFFNMACLAMLRELDWRPDIIHANDWQTGLIPALLRFHPQVVNDPFYQQARTVFTIHNLAYQGIFPPAFLDLARLPWAAFNPDGLEFHKHVSLLKAGLNFSDRLTTVSPSYAREIQTEEFGVGMEGVLQQRAGVLTGILNGIDGEVWNPATDPLLPARYTADDLSGKAVCRRELEATFALKPSDRPILGVVSRLVEQKGFDLVEKIAEALLAEGARLVVLGTGAPRFEKFFAQLAAHHPGAAGARLEYSEAVAHLIEAGSDFFLMPSRFEPSGLNQLYSMAYGTPPIVRRVGGLADSVVDAAPDNLAAGTATGFAFDDYTPAALLSCVERALSLRAQGGPAWASVLRAGMTRDFGWDNAAREYVKVYRDALGG